MPAWLNRALSVDSVHFMTPLTGYPVQDRIPILDPANRNRRFHLFSEAAIDRARMGNRSIITGR